jgi:NAD(P)-dependent dehydrogenase (short-subunit alcohol dehydrogenase family)
MEAKKAVALVTGANRGIGRALVEALLERGAVRVYATARNLADLKQVAALDPKRVRTLQLDVTKPAQISAAAAEARDVNLLINNAGVLDFGSLLEAPGEAVRRNMDTNYYGTLHMSRAFAPLIEGNGGGAVVNVLTVVALASMPGLGVYNASKAAAWSMTQSLRADLAKRKVQVYAVFPGPVDTDMARGIEMAKTSPADVARAVLDGVQAGTEDIFPDPMSQQVYAAWKADHKAVERQFASM